MSVIEDIKENIESKQEKPIYVAFDSDVLSNLALIHKYEKMGGFDVEHCHDKYIQNNYELIKAVYDNIKNGFLRPVILNTVFSEVGAFDDNLEFIKDMCYSPDYTSESAKSKRNQVKKLAKAYSQQYYDELGNLCNAPMDPEYSANTQRWVPSNDAFIMAEATVENLLLITCNEKDYLTTPGDRAYLRKLIAEDKLRVNKVTDTRAIGIRTINKQMGYGGGEGRHTPGPMSFKVFARRLKLMGENFETLDPRYDILRSEDVMDDIVLEGVVPRLVPSNKEVAGSNTEMEN